MPIRKTTPEEQEARRQRQPLRATRNLEGRHDKPYWILRGDSSTLQEAYNKLPAQNKSHGTFTDAQKAVLQILLEDKLTAPKGYDPYSGHKENPYEFGTREWDMFSWGNKPQGIQTDDLKDMVFERWGIRVYNTDLDNLYDGRAITYNMQVVYGSKALEREEEYQESLTPEELEAYKQHKVSENWKHMEENRIKKEKRGGFTYRQES